MAEIVRAPFGNVDNTISLSATGTQAITINNQETVIDGVTIIATGNRTIDLTINSELLVGATLFLKTKTTGTETTIFGTNITAPTITGVAGKTFTQGFMYDGVDFKPVGTSIQID